jgi:hypothetical protein
MGSSDAILALGVLVGRELGYPTLPMLECPSLDYQNPELEGATGAISGSEFRWQPETGGHGP